MSATRPGDSTAPAIDESATVEPRPLDEPGVRVKTHPGLCVGWGQCHRFAPEIYPLDDEGHVDLHLLDVPAEHARAAWIGAQACPEGAITVIGPPEQHWIDREQRRQNEPPEHPVPEGEQ